MAQKLAKQAEPQQQDAGTSQVMNARDTIAKQEFESALKHINGRTDKIPIQLVKKMGSKTRELFRDTLAEKIPRDWKCTRIQLVYKRSGEMNLVENYQPIAVISVIRRLFAHIVCAWLCGWAGRQDVLGELHNGFRPGRRLEDNHSVIYAGARDTPAREQALTLEFLWHSPGQRLYQPLYAVEKH